MSGKSVRIEQATVEDLPGIHHLVRELAVYEKAESEFVAGLEEYQQDFAEGAFEAIVAKSGEEVVGMALYYPTYSTWKGKMLYLEDFVVLEAYRGDGLGQAIFDAFLAQARATGCRLVKWQVLDWNEPALKFYQKNNAIIEKEWWNGKLFL